MGLSCVLMLWANCNHTSNVKNLPAPGRLELLLQLGWLSPFVRPLAAGSLELASCLVASGVPTRTVSQAGTLFCEREKMALGPALCCRGACRSTCLANARLLSLLAFAEGARWPRARHLRTFGLEVLINFRVCILQKPVSCQSGCCSFPNGKMCVGFGQDVQGTDRQRQLSGKMMRAGVGITNS